MNKYQLTKYGQQSLKSYPNIKIHKHGKTYPLANLTDDHCREIGTSVFFEPVVLKNADKE